jgi:hypothetical protein
MNACSSAQTTRSGIPVGRRQRRYRPALACAAFIMTFTAVGCASHAGSGGNSPSSGPVGTLRVTVIQAGGPVTGSGKTPTSPMANTEVKVTAAQSSYTAETNKSGIATFKIPYGKYSVAVGACGSETSRAVTVSETAALTWTCPIP